jgi:Ran GTPase-activating protein (RanGAP) involved in mRNA processing and transport
MDQVWLVNGRNQPLKDNDSVCDFISTSCREVQLLIELKVNKKVLELLPKLQVNGATETSIRVSGAQLRDVDAKKLADALKVNAAVTEVILCGNSIGDSGCAALAEALKVNNAVREVNVGDNSIGDAGCAALAEALKVNNAVTRLAVDSNDVGDAGCVALAEVFLSFF